MCVAYNGSACNLTSPGPLGLRPHSHVILIGVMILDVGKIGLRHLKLCVHFLLYTKKENYVQRVCVRHSLNKMGAINLFPDSVKKNRVVIVPFTL